MIALCTHNLWGKQNYKSVILKDRYQQTNQKLLLGTPIELDFEESLNLGGNEKEAIIHSQLE